MPTFRVLDTSPGGNPSIAGQADMTTALELSVRTEPGVVVVNAQASAEDARLSTTLGLNPDAALDLAMHLIECVGQLRKLEIGEGSDRLASPSAQAHRITDRR
jgi:hypothetical protein